MKHRKALLIGFLTLVILFLPCIIIIVLYHTHYGTLTSSLDYQPNLPTIIYDVNGTEITKLYDEMRQPVAFEEIPQTVIDAFTTAEDRHFYTHNGIDYFGILRAILIDIHTGSIQQGGSTITQQLIKQLYTHKRRTIERKIIELLLVGRIEREFSKDEIITMYLNHIYFGHGVYGIKSAASFFFDKAPGELSIYEASLLALIPPAPNRYSPLKNPQITYDKHRKIMINLVKNGHIDRRSASDGFMSFWNGYLDKLAERSPNEIARTATKDRAPYATEHIRDILIGMYGSDTVHRGGLKVYTTIDIRLQEIARKHLTDRIKQQQSIASRYNRHLIESSITTPAVSALPDSSRALAGSMLKKIELELTDSTELLSLITGADTVGSFLDGYRLYVRHQYQQAQVEGAFTAMEPDSGAVRVLVGGSEFRYDNQLNRAADARRQPGSAFKPFVYAAGIEKRKITAATLFQDLPMVSIQRDRIWAPTNASNSFSGDILVRKAITRSINTIAVLAYEEIGGSLIARQAASMIGIPVERFTVDPTLALGSSEVTPLELARGFAVFANDGIALSPYFIEKIVDIDDTVLYEYKKESQKRVLSRQTAYIMRSFLQNVVTGGTATSTIRGRYGFYDQCAGKTGTNTDYRDAWFAGFTPDLVAVVWIGCDSQKYTLGPGQFGATAAAPVWGQFMKESKPLRRRASFSGRPNGVVSRKICSHSGLLPRDGCPVTGELFLKGTEPVKTCGSSHMKMRSIESLLSGEED
ncbi:MAG: penicillin-binding protein 1A [Spirochaetota bacterium]